MHRNHRLDLPSYIYIYIHLTTFPSRCPHQNRPTGCIYRSSDSGATFYPIASTCNIDWWTVACGKSSPYCLAGAISNDGKGSCVKSLSACSAPFSSLSFWPMAPQMRRHRAESEGVHAAWTRRLFFLPYPFLLPLKLHQAPKAMVYTGPPITGRHSRQ